jgi:hypothetical protein
MRADEVDRAGILYSGFSKYLGNPSPSAGLNLTGGSNFMKLLHYHLRMASGKTPSILMEFFVKLTLLRSSLTILLLSVNIAGEFILGLDAMHSHDASLALRCHV